MNPESLKAHYDPWVVLASIVIAVLAGYVALDLSTRVGRHAQMSKLFVWWGGGSVALGSGIWAMHFIGMLAYSLPITLGYEKGLTFLSWLAAVLVSAVAMSISIRETLGAGRRIVGSVVMGAGICAMHYIGMAAIVVAPGIVWNPWLVAGSVAIAILASGAALTIFFWLRQANPGRSTVYRGLAALAIGMAISGMHYTGMAAASFPVGTVCTSADSLAGDNLAGLVGSAAMALLLVTLATSVVDASAQRKTDRLSASLEVANADLRKANADLTQRALSDPLTDLPNRLLFEDRLRHALTHNDRRQGHGAAGHLAVLFIDLDGFKPVNDSLGHAAGDAVLKEAARRLQAEARSSDTVARIGGDEFLLLMEDVGGLADAIEMAGRLLRSLGQPMDIASQRVEISGSIGIVVHPEQGQRDKLIAHADAAMYAAKRSGGNSYAVFESSMDAHALQQLNLQGDLRHAVERGQMQLYYQPKVDCRRGQIVGAEALLRWFHPVRGPISPVEFIPMAERFGIINSLGQWVIDEACRQMAEWADAGVRMRVSINLSVHQLREADLVPRIRRALETHAVEPSQLLCEITESVAMEDIAATQKAFDGLASIGVFLSIDDFGTGYSSLSYLRQLPARQLKIDRSFIGDLEGSRDARAVVDAVIRLAHALSLQVVAEGVETEGQRAILTELGCDELQGFLFARPMTAERLLAWTDGDKPIGAVEFSASVMHDAA